MLLKYIDKSLGLCNETRLLITRLGECVIEASVLSKDNIEQKVFIPRLVLTNINSLTIQTYTKTNLIGNLLCYDY